MTSEQLELPLCGSCGKSDCGYVQRRKVELCAHGLVGCLTCEMDQSDYHVRPERRASEPPQQLKFRTYDIMHRAIETGIAVGYRRAHKHTSDPDEQSIRDCILREVMNELSDIVDWGDQ